MRLTSRRDALGATALLVAALLGATPAPAMSPSTRPAVILLDPPNDDHGPGSYEYPSDPTLYPRGAFDIRRFEVSVDGNDVVFQVTLGTIIRKPAAPARRTSGEILPLDNQIYVQNIDIYLDTNPTPGAGFTEAIPGRNVRLHPDSAWDVAVVMTPQPALTRSVLKDWEPVSRVLFPTTVSHTGATFTARVRADQLGGLPEPSWGYAVMVSGAQWEQSFNLVGRFALGQKSVNAFTIPVFSISERENFGGGPLSSYTPNVIDLVVPPGESQERALTLPAQADRYVTVPMVYPNPDAYKKERLRRAGAALTPTVELDEERPSIVVRVTDVRANTVILQRPKEGEELAPHRLGVVLDKSGVAVAQVVVTTVFPGFVVAQAIEGQDKISVGASVRFDTPVTN